MSHQQEAKQRPLFVQYQISFSPFAVGTLLFNRNEKQYTWRTIYSVFIFFSLASLESLRKYGNLFEILIKIINSEKEHIVILGISADFVYVFIEKIISQCGI